MLNDGMNCRNVVTKHQETSDRLTKEISQLQSRYDAMSDVKERAAERYKTDYQKWRKFKNWLFADSEEGSKGKEGQELSAEEKKRRRNNNVMIGKKLVMESGLDYAEKNPEGHGDSSKEFFDSCVTLFRSLLISVTKNLSSTHGRNFTTTRSLLP